MIDLLKLIHGPFPSFTHSLAILFYEAALTIEFFYLFRLSLKNLVYIGLRSVDPYERLIAKKFNVHLYGMKVSFGDNPIARAGVFSACIQYLCIVSQTMDYKMYEQTLDTSASHTERQDCK